MNLQDGMQRILRSFGGPLLPLLILSSSPAEVLFSDDFSGGATPLHGITPVVTTDGTSWVAAPVFSANGTVAGGASGASATLRLVPVEGYVYTLDASLSGVSLLGIDDRQWLALGFATGQSNATGTGHRFISNAVVGRAWMIFRGGGALFDNTAFLTSTTGGETWTNWPSFPAGVGGDIDLRITLDTTGSLGNSIATWWAKRPADEDYTIVRPATVVPDAATISSVGFARSSHQINATLTHFSLNVEGDGPPPPPPTPDPVVTFIPVSDGDPSTDENGYAGSAINSIAFAQNNLITIGNQQIISYYRRHANNAGDPQNNTVVVARREIGSGQWEIFPTDFQSFNINDTHNVISCAIDGDGFLHMSWGMHNHSLLYAKSAAPVSGNAPIEMISLGTAGMTGQETSVTYPKFQTLPDGDVVFLFRMGGSGNGDWYLHRYDTSTATWSPIHATSNGTTRPLFQGRGQSPNNCFYPDRLTLGPDGMLHLSGVFRYNASSLAGETGYQTNHRYVYLRSPDRGDTWQRSDGSTIDLPVINNASFLNLGESHVPEIVEDLPEGHSIINEQGLTTDRQGRPIIATWFAANAQSGDHTRQYHIYFYNGTTWQRRTLSARTLDNPAQKFAEAQLSSSRMGRPIVLTDAEDRIIVLYNDNRFDGITAVFSLPLAQDPDRLHWTRVNLTHQNLGNWEATYDEERWKRDNVLHMLYQPLPGMGMSYAGQNNSSPVSVVEWNARVFFSGPPTWTVDTVTDPGQASVRVQTQVGFRYDLRSSTDLDFSEAPAVTLPGDGFWRELGRWPTIEPRRFWQLQRIEEPTDGL